MSREPNDNRQWLDWGAAGQPLAGETESGDAYLVKFSPGGALLVVVDGLGHGPEAAIAARAAISALDEYSGETIVRLVERCHQKIRSTRGVVLSAAWIEPGDGHLTWLGVGDVDGLLVRADAHARPHRECLLARGGVVGYQLPPLRSSRLPLHCGDTLILNTDGIRSGFDTGLNLQAPPRQIADDILASHRRGTDDALVLVATYTRRGDD